MNEEKKALLEKERARVSRRMSPEIEKSKVEKHRINIGCFIGLCLCFIFIVIPASCSSERSQPSHYNSLKVPNKYDVPDHVWNKLGPYEKRQKNKDLETLRKVYWDFKVNQ